MRDFFLGVAVVVICGPPLLYVAYLFFSVILSGEGCATLDC